MQKHYSYITIDLDKKIYTKLKAVQGDSKSRCILANLIDNNVCYDLSGTCVKVYGVKKDKTIFFNDATIVDATKGQFELELTNQALAVAGDLKIQILILGSNQEKLSTFSFFIEVGESIIDDEAIESSNEFTALITSLSKLEEWNGYFEETSGKIEEKYTERLNNLDEQFNTIKTYPVLDNETGVVDVRYQYGDVRRFGAKGDGEYDNSIAFDNCLKSLGGIWTDLVSTMYIPAGVWKYTQPIRLDRNNMTLKGDGMEQTILRPTNCDGIKTYGSTSNSRYGVIVKDFAINGGNMGFDASYFGLNCLIKNISIHSCSGVGYYAQDAFDHKVENVMVRECGGLGYHINQTETTESTVFAEMSYITFENCVAVHCNNQGTQWKISGNNMYLNNCKANECSVGIEFVGTTWACRIDKFYMDGIDKNSVMFKVDSEAARNITFENTYGWNIGYVIQATRGRSIIGRNLDVNPGSWEYKAVKIDDTYTGIVDLDNKNYVIEDNRSDKHPFIFHGDFADLSGYKIWIKEVELEMYQGGWEYEYSFPSVPELGIKNVFVTPMSDITYIARDNIPGAKLTPSIHATTNGEGWFNVVVSCPNIVKEAKTIKLQIMIILKPTKPYQ